MIEKTPPETQLTHMTSSTTNIEEELTTQNLYKTELCRSFEDTGTCRYGSKCQFAHGVSDLRPVLRHPKYKTEVCKTFHTIGTCPYGKRCRFIHIPPDENEILESALSDDNKTQGKSSIDINPEHSLLLPSSVINLPQVSALPISPISALSVPSQLFLTSPILSCYQNLEEEGNESSSDNFDLNEHDFEPPAMFSSNLEHLLESLNQQEWEEKKSEEISSKKDPERRLSIFQQICSEQAISV